jgi:hypothetical protein
MSIIHLNSSPQEMRMHEAFDYMEQVAASERDALVESREFRADQYLARKLDEAALRERRGLLILLVFQVAALICVVVYQTLT